MQQTILITGANGNLGKALSEHFLKNNWQVFGLVHKAMAPISKSDNYTQHAVDLLDESATQKTIESLFQAAPITAAVLTAGGFRIGDIKQADSATLDQQYQLNFKTAYHCIRPLHRLMQQQKKGRLVMIGSRQGIDTTKGQSAVAYALSKSLLLQLCRLLNATKADTGVATQLIIPDIIDTPQNKQAMPEADTKNWQKPEDIAAIIGKQLEAAPPFKEIIKIKEALLDL